VNGIGMAVLAGFFLGIAAAVPIGPIGILAVTQRLRHGFGRGFSGALASSGMEVLYSLVAVQAASFVNSFILKYSHIMKLVGTAVLVFVGIGILRQARTFDPAVVFSGKEKKELHPVWKTIMLYVSSPTLPAFWLTAAGLVVAHGWVEPGHPSAILFALACGAGSAFWYFVLLRLILREPVKVEVRVFRVIFLVLGALLVVLAVLNIASIWIKIPGKMKIL
jgi:threonine/homoserine/homoserine lactone efflux protein